MKKERGEGVDFDNSGQEGGVSDSPMYMIIKPTQTNTLLNKHTNKHTQQNINMQNGSLKVHQISI